MPKRKKNHLELPTKPINQAAFLSFPPQISLTESLVDIPITLSLDNAPSYFSVAAPQLQTTNVNVPIYLDTSCQYNSGASTSNSINLTKNKRPSNPRLVSTIDIPQEVNVLKIVPSCKHCKAIRFLREPPSFCCSGGQVKLYTHAPPPELWELFTAQDSISKEFRKYARTYNNNFAFTSMGVRSDANLSRRNKGIYTFKAQGQVYHFINSLLPLDENPSNLQLYYYDTEHEIANRLKISDRMTETHIIKIMHILQNNPYCQFFRSLTEIPCLETCTIVLKQTPSRDQRVYNAPTVSQVAAIWVEGELDSGNTREIFIFTKPGEPLRIWHYFACYDSLQYPLLFPYGQPGWHRQIKRCKTTMTDDLIDQPLPIPFNDGNVQNFLENENRVMNEGLSSRQQVSCREYYCKIMQIHVGEFSLPIHGGRLTQQYVVDMYIKLESSRLDFFSHNQKKIRADLYSGVLDSIAIGERRGFKIGKQIVLPASFIGGPRDFRARYLDSMALVKNFGKPDFFITMTCNPNWTEIKQNLLPGEEAQNRPDLLSRIFRAKIEELKDDILKKHVLGPVVAYVYVIEFQKRGLPHMHMLLILQQSHKIKTADQYDHFVSAEIPNQTSNPHLYRTVCKHMLHGPCGVLNKDNVCMKPDGSCRNHYPKEFCEITSQTKDAYPLYRRRNNNATFYTRDHVLNNQWVIPYNPYLLAKFNCHLNVEICSTVKAVKYLYKYIYKGHDRVAFNVTEGVQTIDVNEITNFREGRWISPPEAMWRIYGFLISQISPAVITLQLHLENNQTVSYANHADLEDVVNSPLCGKTTLTEFFVLNATNPVARAHLYTSIPEVFVWNSGLKIWTPRKRGIAIGRVVAVSPIEGERYYLKMLLAHIKGPTSFADLKLFKDVLCNSFKEAAVLHGLIEEDSCFQRAMAEACSYQMPSSLRKLFSTLLCYCNPINARSLWEEFSVCLSEDFTHSYDISQSHAAKMALRDIAYHLESMGKDINNYMLIDGSFVIEDSERGNKEIHDELNIDITATDTKKIAALNNEQKLAYNLIMDKVLTSTGGAFFVDGPGGTGKTYLYCALLAAVRAKGHIALATASSGVAASLMPGGRTAHSRFKIPLNIDDRMVCNISKQSGLAKLLRLAKLIIWDEAPMMRRQSIESVERMLRDICESVQPFGGKVFVFGGDFRQVLPVVPKGSMHQTLNASLVQSPLWMVLTKIHLATNMRAQLDPQFSEYLLRIGEGTEPNVVNDEILLPASMIIPYEGEVSLITLINRTFPDLNCYSGDIDSIINRAILTTRNEFVDRINDKIIDSFPGEFQIYHSFDMAIETSQQGLQEDFFNNMTPSGFPPHLLRLKNNCPIMLLRNIDPSIGLCNGTRLICTSFNRNVIGATIATGTYRGKHVFLPRIPLTPPTSEIGSFPFCRKQFPIRLCFGMTINKAQGQTLDFVGLYLPQPVFSHGQLYVALSRATTGSAITILLIPRKPKEICTLHTRNVVCHELLQLAANT